MIPITTLNNFTGCEVQSAKLISSCNILANEALTAGLLIGCLVGSIAAYTGLWWYHGRE